MADRLRHCQLSSPVSVININTASALGSLTAPAPKVKVKVINI